jgi:MFS family permease
MKRRFPNLSHYFTYFVGDRTTRQNILNNIKDGAWYSVMLGLTSSFTGVFAIALGASDEMLGWLSSLPALLSMLSQIPAARLTERSPSRLRVSLRYGLIFRSGYLLFAFIPFLPIAPIYRAWTFILLVSLMNFPGTVSGVAWSAMMGDIFPGSLRGRIFADRNMLLGIVQMAVTLVAGPLLDNIAYPYNYALIYLLSFGALMTSSWYQSKIVEQPASAELLPAAAGAGGGGGAVTSVVETAEETPPAQASGAVRVRQVLGDRPFVMYLVSLFIFYLGLNVSAAMWTILYVRVLGLSQSFIGFRAVVSQLISVLCYRWWGRHMDRHGPMFSLFIVILAYIPQPFLYNYARGVVPLLAMSVYGGFTAAGLNLVLFNSLLDMAPNPQLRPSYIAVYNLVIGVTGFVLPMIGVAIYEASSMAVVFNLSSTLRLIGAGFMAWKVGVRSRAARAA